VIWPWQKKPDETYSEEETEQRHEAALTQEDNLNPTALLQVLHGSRTERFTKHQKQTLQFVVASRQINCGPILQMKAKNGF